MSLLRSPERAARERRPRRPLHRRRGRGRRRQGARRRGRRDGRRGRAGVGARAASTSSCAAAATSCSTQDGVKVFAEWYGPPPRLLVYGAVDTAEALARGAKLLGWTAIVADARATFLTPERIPSADRLIAKWPTEAIAEVAPDHQTAIVVLTHDDKFDEPALIARARLGGVLHRRARLAAQPGAAARAAARGGRRRRRRSSASRGRAASTSAPTRRRRRRSRSSPRSSPSAPAARAARCARRSSASTSRRREGVEPPATPTAVGR